MKGATPTPPTIYWFGIFGTMVTPNAIPATIIMPAVMRQASYGEPEDLAKTNATPASIRHGAAEIKIV